MRLALPGDHIRLNTSRGLRLGKEYVVSVGRRSVSLIFLTLSHVYVNLADRQWDTLTIFSNKIRLNVEVVDGVKTTKGGSGIRNGSII